MLTILVTVAPSPIHGLGVYTLEPLKKGDVIWSFVPKYDLDLHAEELGCGFERLRHFSFQGLRGAMVLCVDEARYMNFPERGEEANTALGMIVNSEHQLIAAHDIPAGVELTVPLESDFDASWKLRNFDHFV